MRYSADRNVIRNIRKLKCSRDMSLKMSTLQPLGVSETGTPPGILQHCNCYTKLCNGSCLLMGGSTTGANAEVFRAASGTTASREGEPPCSRPRSRRVVRLVEVKTPSPLQTHVMLLLSGETGKRWSTKEGFAGGPSGCHRAANLEESKRVRAGNVMVLTKMVTSVSN
ncbi:unnamed protein product [Lota lota]